MQALCKRRERHSVQSLVQTAGTELPCGADNNFIYGKIPEWPNGSDCKSDVSDFGSSNLPLPTSKKTAKTRRKHGFLPFFLYFSPFPLAIILREPCQKPNLKPNFLCNHFYRRFCFFFKTIAADRLSAAIFPFEWKNIFPFCPYRSFIFLSFPY